MEIKDFTPRSTHKWHCEGEPWHRVHMDHALVNGIGLFSILVDSFSGLPGSVEGNIFMKWSSKNSSI